MTIEIGRAAEAPVVAVEDLGLSSHLTGQWGWGSRSQLQTPAALLRPSSSRCWRKPFVQVVDVFNCGCCWKRRWEVSS